MFGETQSFIYKKRASSFLSSFVLFSVSWGCSAFCAHSATAFVMSITNLSDQLGILTHTPTHTHTHTHRVASPNHLCDSILGPSESPLPARRWQGASMLELNSFAFWHFGSPVTFFRSGYSTYNIAQHRLVSTLQSNPTSETGRDGKIIISFLLSHGDHPSKH